MRWRLKSPVSLLFTQPFIQAQIKENIKAPRHWPLCEEFIGDQWISLTNGQQRGKCFHWLASSWTPTLPLTCNIEPGGRSVYGVGQALIPRTWQQPRLPGHSRQKRPVRQSRCIGLHKATLERPHVEQPQDADMLGGALAWLMKHCLLGVQYPLSWNTQHIMTSSHGKTVCWVSSTRSPETNNTLSRHHTESAGCPHSIQKHTTHCDVITREYSLLVVQHPLPWNMQHIMTSPYGTQSTRLSSILWRHYVSARCPAPVQNTTHCEVITWNHFLYYWLLVRGVHQWLSPVDYLTKGKWFALWVCFFVVIMITLSWKTTHNVK